MTAVAYFPAGPRKKIGEKDDGNDIIYSPNGWLTDKGGVHLCISPDISVDVTDDGRCKVWFQGRRVL